VNELKGESGVECEAAYETALWMLYALVDVTMQDNEQVDEDDRVTVDKCECLQRLAVAQLQGALLTGRTSDSKVVKSIQGRLEALRRKTPKSHHQTTTST
jgi:Domain of unknown function (DUF3543)